MDQTFSFVMGLILVALTTAYPQTPGLGLAINSTSSAQRPGSNVDFTDNPLEDAKKMLDTMGKLPVDPLPDFDQLPDHYRNSTHRIEVINGMKVLITTDTFKEGDLTGQIETYDISPLNSTVPSPSVRDRNMTTIHGSSLPEINPTNSPH